MTTPNTPPVPPRKWTPARIAQVGCGTVAAFIALFGIGFYATLQSKMNEPYNVADELNGLAGVPVYPGATIDEETTRAARATAATLRGLYPADSTTAVGFRTNDDPRTKIIPFYDAAMAQAGFTKTTLGGGLGDDGGASYVSEGCRVIIQTQDESGEDRQLTVMRFDSGVKRFIGKRTDIVTPDDFKKP